VTYRTKALGLLLLLVAIGNGLIAYTDYREFSGMLRMEIHYKVRSIAFTAGSLLNPEALARIRTPADQNSPDYAELIKTLRQVRNANRRKDTYVQRIFTLSVSSRDPSALQYGVDTAESLENIHQVGDIYRLAGSPVTGGLASLLPHTNVAYEAWARFNTAYAPIYNHNRELVGVVAVVDSEPLYGPLRELRPRILIPFGLSLRLALIFGTILAQHVTSPLYKMRTVIDSITRGNFDTTVPQFPGGEFAEMSKALTTMEAGLRERDTVKNAFSGYISRQVLDAVLSSGGVASLTGERRRITVLFADIRGFTTLSETMQPEEVVQLLSEFFDRMVDVVIRNHGTIDKFLGDGMMAIFGAPLTDPYQEEHAVRAALEMQAELRTLREKWQSEGRHPIRIGIGINSGNAIVGNIGSKEHMEYTAIGDMVNLASRLESESKTVGVEILVSDSTHDGTRPLFKWKEAGALHVKGREEAVQAYSVEGISGLNAASPPATDDGRTS
jgi:adenylate cyclase